MAYMSSSSFGTDGGEAACFLCKHSTEDSEDAPRVVHRGRSAYVILNAYPYNTGHVLIAPNRHVADLESLDDEERLEVMELTTRCTTVIKNAMNAQGFNVGMNLGVAAGAGVPGHLHIHVVPRWGGDTNFMPIVGETKVLPEMLADTYKKLHPGFST